MNDFTTFANRYFISADLVMERPLHIGKGTSLEPVGTDLPVIKDEEGYPCIPGSSVKGVVRSEVEKILRTFGMLGKKLRNIEKIWACDVFDNRCVDEKKKNEIKNECIENNRINEAKFTEELWKETCTACRIFGSPWMASRVYFKDMYLNNKDLYSFEIRDGVAIDRDTGTAKSGFKFDYEIVSAGSVFKLYIILENLEEWEVGLLGLVLKRWENGEIAIGGKTSSGLGWSKLQNLIIERVDKENLVEYLIEGKKSQANLVDFIKVLKEKLG